MSSSAFEYAMEVDKRIDELSNEDFHRKKGEGKVLLEELYPLSRLALSFKQPGLQVLVEGFEDCRRADGRIVVSGFKCLEAEIQITFAGYSYDDSLRSELLLAQGSTPGSGEIKRINGKIVATMEAVDADEYIDKLVMSIVSIFQKKSKMEYLNDTILLIAFGEYKLSSNSKWALLFSNLTAQITTDETPFSGIYLFNCWTNQLRLLTGAPKYNFPVL
jgi:hypothetical protein